MKLHLVDGTYELFRAFYGAPPATAPDGTEVGATRGMLRTLLRLLGRSDVTHVAVAFDYVIESFRNDLFAGYKTGVGLDPKLTGQFRLVEDASRALGLVTWPLVEFEADDGVAAAAARWADDVDQVVICTPDKDMAQCVRGHRVVTWDRMRNKVYDEDGVMEKFGVAPKSIPHWLALVGDSADGIPGIPRWGAKSAAAVLRRYGSLLDIPEDPDTWDVKVRGAKTLAENLWAQRDDAALYLHLATLRTDVPIEETLADLEWRGADRDLLEALADRIGDSEVVGNVRRWR